MDLIISAKFSKKSEMPDLYRKKVKLFKLVARSYANSTLYTELIIFQISIMFITIEKTGYSFSNLIAIILIMLPD